MTVTTIPATVIIELSLKTWYSVFVFTILYLGNPQIVDDEGMIAKFEIIYWVSLLAPNDGGPVINNSASLPDKTASLLLDNEIFCPNQGHLHSSRAEVSWVTNYRARWSCGAGPHYWLMNGDGCLQVRTFLWCSHAIVQVAGNEPFHHPHSLTTTMSDSQHFKHLMRFQRNVEK